MVIRSVSLRCRASRIPRIIKGTRRPILRKRSSCRLISPTRHWLPEFAKYLAEITYRDDQVGQILALIDKHDLRDNTMVMVVSEQGNAFPFAKWTCYDMGLQSIMIVRWRGMWRPSVSDAIVEYTDVTPTFVDAAGGTPAVLDGKSFLPVLRGDTQEHKDYTYGLMTTRGIIRGVTAIRFVPFRTSSSVLSGTLIMRECFVTLP